MLVDGPAAPGRGVLAARPNGGAWLGRWRARLDSLPWRAYHGRKQETFSCDWVPSRLAGRVNELRPDLVHVHWIGGGMLRLEELASIKAPLVWTLHDMWPLTGGCHHSHDCQSYQDRCGACPQLGGSKTDDLSARVLRRKRAAWAGLDMSVAAPSRWLAQCAEASRLFAGRRVETIIHGVDLEIFSPQHQSRQELGLSPDKPLLLFVAEDAVNNPFKGFDLLLSALERLAALGWQDKAELLVLGSNAPSPPLASALPIRFLGPVEQARSLALVYSAADVLAAPSRSEALGLTVMEAMACGTPAAAFGVGGIPDMITDGLNGRLAPPGEVEALAQAMHELLADTELREHMGRQARQEAEARFGLPGQARAYIQLYEEILKS